MWNLILHVLITAAVNWATHSTEYVEQKKATLERNWRQRLLSSLVQTACCLRWVRMRLNHFHTTKGTTSEFPTLPRPPLKRVDILVRGQCDCCSHTGQKQLTRFNIFWKGRDNTPKTVSGHNYCCSKVAKEMRRLATHLLMILDEKERWKGSVLHLVVGCLFDNCRVWELEPTFTHYVWVVMEVAQLPIWSSLWGDNFQALRPLFYWIISHVCTSLMTCASSTKDVFKLKL